MAASGGIDVMSEVLFCYFSETSRGLSIFDNAVYRSPKKSPNDKAFSVLLPNSEHTSISV